MFKHTFPFQDELQALFPFNSEAQLSSLQLFQHFMQHMCQPNMVKCESADSCQWSKAETISRLHAMATDHHKSLLSDPLFQTYSQLKSYPFLQRLVTRLTGVPSNSTLYLSMGDGFMLQYVLASLQIPTEGLLPLASR